MPQKIYDEELGKITVASPDDTKEEAKKIEAGLEEKITAVEDGQ